MTMLLDCDDVDRNISLNDTTIIESRVVLIRKSEGGTLSTTVTWQVDMEIVKTYAAMGP